MSLEKLFPKSFSHEMSCQELRKSLSYFTDSDTYQLASIAGYSWEARNPMDTVQNNSIWLCRVSR